MKRYIKMIPIWIGLLQAYTLLPDFKAIKTMVEKPSEFNQNHKKPIATAIKASNTPQFHDQPMQETQQIVAPENIDHPTITSPKAQSIDSISLDQLTNSPTQSKNSSITKPASINSAEMNIKELTPLLKKYRTKDYLADDEIQTLERLFKSSHTQTYHPNSFDPKSMSPNMTTKDYVEPLQVKFPNTPSFMLEKYVDMVLAESKSGQAGWLSKWPILTPQDVLNYKPGYPETDSGVRIGTSSDLQILYHDMQAIEKITTIQKIYKDNANKLHAAQKITKTITGNISIPAIETEKITFKSFTGKGFPTNEEIKNLMIKQYFPNKNNDDVTVNIVSGGSFTDNIYSVSHLNKPVFFLKISKEPESADNLIGIQQSSIGRIGMQSQYESALKSNIQKNLPIVTWMEKLYTYKDTNNENRTIEVMHAAKGKSIYAIINDPKINNASKLNACAAAGKALGSFQQFFIDYTNPNNPATWKTVAHGDFHHANIFFDAQKSQIYLIDNETMTEDRLKEVKSLKWFKQGSTDLKYFLLATSKFYGNRENVIKVSVNEISNAFIHGYFESFPADKRSILAQYLKENSGLDPQYFDPYITPSTQTEASQVNQPAPASTI